MPALFSECLKNICYVKKIPLIRVLHPSMSRDKPGQQRLYELTSQTSLPTMWHDEERPVPGVGAAACSCQGWL